MSEKRPKWSIRLGLVRSHISKCRIVGVSLAIYWQRCFLDKSHTENQSRSGEVYTLSHQSTGPAHEELP